MDKVREDFHRTITEALALFESMTEAESGFRTEPGSWSPKEVLGHLIDSATQNHRRFVELFGQDNLEFPPYDQEHWVGVQMYRARPWKDLVQFWLAYNRRMDENVITIRRGTPEDSELLAEFGARTFAETFGPQNNREDMEKYLNKAFSPEVIRAELDHPGNVFFIAFSGSLPVGYIKLRHRPPPTSVQGPAPIELERIYVLGTYAAQGIGSRLKDMALSEARAHSYKTIWLGVWKENHKAQKVYHHWGFEIVGEQTFSMGEDLQFDWVMARPVNL